MKFLIIIQNNPSVGELYAGMSEEGQASAFQIYWDVERDLRESGELVDSAAVDDRAQTIVQRGAAGEAAIVSAAPQPSAGTVVSGYYLVDVRDADRAHEIAARFPEALVADGVRVARTLSDEELGGTGA